MKKQQPKTIPRGQILDYFSGLVAQHTLVPAQYGWGNCRCELAVNIRKLHSILFSPTTMRLGDDEMGMCSLTRRPND